MVKFFGNVLNHLPLLALLLLNFVGMAYAESDDTNPESVVVLLFMFLSLVLCCAVMHVLSLYNDVIPYTVVVFLLGILFSAVADENHLSSFGSSLNMFVNMDANLILYVFLPVLIFGEAMNLNWHHVQGALFQSFLLAGPGVIMGSILMGTIIKYLLPYNWSWNLSLTFGAILSATDPVAVVALLKDAGAAPKLTILIVGESLMNDGTAMVLFTLFFNMLQGETYTAGGIVAFFIEAAVGSPLTGIVAGFIMVAWLKLANRSLKGVDTTIQIIVTVCGAYLIFFVAQYTFEISGVLACCGGGVILCWLAPPLILNHETMHNVWSFLEWLGNTLIFLIAGLIMGHRTFSQVLPQDWLLMLAIYFIVMIVRCFLIAILYPWLSTTGHRCTVWEAAFMAWSGLRGALAIALALIVENSRNSGVDQEDLDRFLFYVGGVAALTIIVNGTLAKVVLYQLGLIGNESQEKEMVMMAIRKRLRLKMNDYIENMESVLVPGEADELRQSMSLFSRSQLDGPNDFPGSQQPSFSGAPGGAAAATAATGAKMMQSPVGAAGSSSAGGAAAPAAAAAAKDASKAKAKPNAPMRRNRSHASMKDDDGDDGVDMEDTPLFVNTLISYPTSASLQRQKSGSRLGGPLENDNPLTAELHKPRSRRGSRTSDMESANEESDGTDDEAPASAAPPSMFGSGGARMSRASLNKLSFRNLSMSRRGPHAPIMRDLLAYVRTVFLELCRVQYWKMIQSNKLPRASHSSKFLLYSIDVGLDDTQDLVDGLRDWHCICAHLDHVSPHIRILAFIEGMLPRNACSGSVFASWLAFFVTRREKRAVYILTAFIEAHEIAQRKITAFLGGGMERGASFGENPAAEDPAANSNPYNPGASGHGQTPEEAKVIQESQRCVQRAKAVLSLFSEETVVAVRSKQRRYMILTKQVELVKGMVKEGLLAQKHAEQFIEDIIYDYRQIDKEGSVHMRKQQNLLQDTIADAKARNSLSSLPFAVRPSMASASITLGNHGNAPPDERDVSYGGPPSNVSGVPPHYDTHSNHGNSRM